jgi:hypothetical protein
MLGTWIVAGGENIHSPRRHVGQKQFHPGYSSCRHLLILQSLATATGGMLQMDYISVFSFDDGIVLLPIDFTSHCDRRVHDVTSRA